MFILIKLLGQAEKTLFYILVCDSDYFPKKYKRKSTFQNKAHLLLPVKSIHTHQLHIINLSVGELVNWNPVEHQPFPLQFFFLNVMPGAGIV